MQLQQEGFFPRQKAPEVITDHPVKNSIGIDKIIGFIKTVGIALCFEIVGKKLANVLHVNRGGQTATIQCKS